MVFQVARVARLLLGGVSAVALSWATSASAEAATGAATQIEEVVVTAERREANLQDVPLAVSAFSGESLQAAGVTNAQDLGLVTPGFIFGSVGTQGIPTIRGVGASLQGAALDPAVSMYVDGVYIPRVQSSIFEMLDVERVEVLRGPQGTLYGRNSTGGAMKFITKSPEEEFSAEATVGGGNYRLFRATAVVNAPITDRLFFRASVLRVRDDGYTLNLGNPTDRPDQRDLFSARAAMKILLGTDTDLTLRGYAEDKKGSANANKVLNQDTSPFFAALGAKPIADPRVINAPNNPRLDPFKSWGLNAALHSNLGAVTLNAVSAYNYSKLGPQTSDTDTTELSLINISIPGQPNSGLIQRSRSFSQEVTLSGEGERFNWIAGAFYFREDGANGGVSGGGAPFTGLGVPGEYTFLAKTRAAAAFVNGGYDLTDRLRLTAGLRYSRERKSRTQTTCSIVSSAGVNTNVCAAPAEDSKSWGAWTPRIGLDFKPTDDMLLYASYSRGFKSGGYAAGSTAPAVEPETIDAFEGGLKSTWRDARLRVNAAVFQYDYRNLQVQQIRTPPLPTLVLNAASAKIRGAEVEIVAAPVAHLELRASVALLHARYGDFATVDQLNPLRTNAEGRRLQNSPDATFSLGAAYDIDLGDTGALRLQADYFHSSRKYFTPFEQPLASQAPYGKLNARATFTRPDGRWSLSVWGRNLTDETTVSAVTLIGTGAGATALGWLEAPRTYGAELSLVY